MKRKMHQLLKLFHVSFSLYKYILKYICFMEINNQVINNDGIYVLRTIPMRLVIAMITSLVIMTCVCEHQFKEHICTLTN